MTDAQFQLMSTRDILIDIQTRLERMEEKQDTQVKEIAGISAREDTNKRMINAAWAVIMLLVTGIIGIAFFVLQSSLRLPGIVG